MSSDKTYQVLFVDDEESILSALRRGLFEEEYRCLFANSGAKALELLEQEEVAVIVTDMRMPGMDGLHLLRLVKERYPAIVRIVLSGYTQLQQILTTINSTGVFKFITKPWMMDEELKVVINEALAYYKLQERKEELELALRKQNASYQNILRKLDTVVDNAARQASVVGDIACEALRSMAERDANVPVLPAELRVLGRLLRLFAARALYDAVDRSGTDVAILYRTALLRSFQAGDIDMVPLSENVNIRMNAILLESLVEGLMLITADMQQSGHVRLALQAETAEDQRMLSVSMLLMRKGVSGQDAFQPATNLEMEGSHASSNEAALKMTNQVLDPIMKTMQGRFEMKATGVGLLCRFLLPIQKPAASAM